MDLSRASIEEMLDELHRRGFEYSLAVSQPADDDPESTEQQYELHSSFPDALHQSVHFLLAALSILGDSADQREEEADPRGEEYRRWQFTGETLLNDMLRVGQEWAEEQERN
jgi:hypothetical protein